MCCGEPWNLAHWPAEFGKICREKLWSISMIRGISTLQQKVSIYSHASISYNQPQATSCFLDFIRWSTNSYGTPGPSHKCRPDKKGLSIIAMKPQTADRTYHTVGILRQTFQCQQWVIWLNNDVGNFFLIWKNWVGLDQLFREPEIRQHNHHSSIPVLSTNYCQNTSPTVIKKTVTKSSFFWRTRNNRD